LNITDQLAKRMKLTPSMGSQFGLGAMAGFGSNSLAVPAVKTTNKKIIAMPTRKAIKSVIAFLLLIV
jgi:hypothetical protein